MEKVIDLHIHSNLSDGVLSPKQIVDEACKNGVSVIAIADHDTIDAYTDEFYDYAKSKNISVINAVEISTKISKCGIHVLGYDFDIHHNEFREKLLLLRNARHDYLYHVAELLNQLGYQLNVKKLDKIEAVTKAHIALDVIENPKNKKVLLQSFGHIPNKGEFIETVMNEGCPAYVKKATITPKEASQLIKRAGGKVILAHPVAYCYEDNLGENDILDLVNEMEADGIESNYIYIDCHNHKINEVDKWNLFAKNHNLITTIGSDFHNDDGIHPVIGLVHENLNIANDLIDKIIDNLKVISENG